MFITLQGKLVTSPVLAYQLFSQSFTLETDTSILRVCAELSQKQEDGKLQPIAFPNRALNRVKKDYSMMELEKLAVV